MVTLKDAVALPGGDAQSPKLQAALSSGEDGRGWHWSEAADGTALICVQSLLRRND
jgi:hypothetical protein